MVGHQRDLREVRAEIGAEPIVELSAVLDASRSTADHHNGEQPLHLFLRLSGDHRSLEAIYKCHHLRSTHAILSSTRQTATRRTESTIAEQRGVLNGAQEDAVLLDARDVERSGLSEQDHSNHDTTRSSQTIMKAHVSANSKDEVVIGQLELRDGARDH